MHDDYLRLAQDLIPATPGAPPQASLRRAVSTAYYALFHRLISYSVRNVVGVAGLDTGFGLAMTRWYAHGRMKEVSGWFSRRGGIPERISNLLSFPSKGTPGFGVVPAQLVDICVTFIRLQEARHRADYDREYRLKKTLASSLVADAGQAFQDLDAIGAEPATKLFGLLLLTGGSVVVER